MFLVHVSICICISVSASVRHRIQMTGDENGVGGRVRFLAYQLVMIDVFFNCGLDGSINLNFKKKCTSL